MGFTQIPLACLLLFTVSFLFKSNKTPLTRINIIKLSCYLNKKFKVKTILLIK